MHETASFPDIPGALAFIGGGNMARSLIAAVVRAGLEPSRIQVAEPVADLRDELTRSYGVRGLATATEAADGADVIVLAVKPQVLAEVARGLAPRLAARRPLLISVAAGVRLDQLEAWLGEGLAIVRAMPNTPALVGAGASGLIANAATTPDQRAWAEAVLGAAGHAEWIADEGLMDVVTALSGSGPAYFFLLVEALEDAAVAAGLSRETARALATRTCLGAGRMLVEDGADPATLRERVTSPGGTTAAALAAFADGGLRELAARAVNAAIKRGRELAAGDSGPAP